MARYCVGLTGGIASGKSAASARFVQLGIVVVDADVVAREVVEPGQPALVEVVAAFGRTVLGGDGRLDRAALRAHVFSDAAARARLEAILHPRIRASMHEQALAAEGSYTIAAIPLLAEGSASEAYRWLDRVLVIDAPRELQLARLVARDGVDRELAERMLAAQADRRQRLAIADDVIVNDGAPDRLVAQVDALDQQYRALSALTAG